MKRWAITPLLLVLGMLLWPLSALGQGATTASIQGQVTDADGQPLPGANVVAVHVPSGTQYGASANQSGQYTLANMRPGGPYRITVSFVGYQSKREEGARLDLGQTLNLNFTLQEKTAEMEEVEVIAKTTGILSSERDGLVTNVSSAELEEQPTMSRSIADVARLTPQSYVVNSNDDGPAISIAGQWNRFNSIYVDGAVTNDVFGLSAQGTPGGQSGASPISLSAVEAMSVEVSPYEVTKSGFVGGAINFTTKSGTNDYEGSFEYYRRGANLIQSNLTVGGETRVDGIPSTTSSDRYVFSLGGPIIKDRLFFFVNTDIRRQNEGKPLQPGYEGTLDLRGGNPQDGELTSVFEIREFMQRNTGYDPGTPGSKFDVLEADKFLARLDFNVNSNHKLTARYWYNDNFNRDRFQSTQTGINFENNTEVFPSTQHNAMLQWNGTFGSSVATKTTATFQNVVDDRGVEGEPFPDISITDGGAGISLGSNPFSYPNFLEQTVATFTNQTDVFLGNHTLTVGTHNEFYSIDNRFAIFGPGSYSFDNVSDFAETVCHYAEQNQGQFGIQGPGPVCQQYPNPSPQTAFYIHQYSLLDDNPNTPEFEQGVDDDTNLRSDFNSTKLGFFVQDKWQPIDRLNLTLGLRADLPKILTDPGAHPSANEELLPAVKDAGYDLNGATAGEMPDWQVFWSPRFGFNYALTEERNTQIRGGTGVFTSRLPNVWPGAAYLNNGQAADVAVGLGFAGSLPLRRPQNGLTKFDDAGIFGGGAFGATPPSSVEELTPTGNLILFREDFSYPRVLRTTLGVDQALPFGFTGTLEGQYSSKLQDVIVQNVNLKQPDANLEAVQTNDDRPIYTQPRDPNTSINVDSRYGDVYLLDNTDKGYSYTVTGRLQKEPTAVWDGGSVRGMLSYTYGDSRSLNQFGDTVGSNWGDNPHKSTTNNLTLGRSPFSLGHRIQLSLGYRQEFTENISTDLSLYYNGQSGRPFSYTIGGGAATQMVGDEGGPPLFYIPEDASNLTFAPIERNGNVVRTPEQQAQDLETFIQNVEYLSNNRGEYATRNGDRTPFEGVMDLQFALNFSGELVGRNQRLSLTANVFNFSSLLGDIFGTDWGYRYQQAGLVSPVNFVEFADADGDGNARTPVYQSALGAENPETNLEETFNVESGTQTYSTLYQVRIGVKYTF
jgi:outer membrane receptor for ferrienterochelin and colicin